MAPQKSTSQGDQKKQITLNAWFEKSTNLKTSSNAKSSKAKAPAPADLGVSASVSQVLPSGTRLGPKTPESKKPDARILNSSAGRSPLSSDGGYSAMDTPPTSDIVDVDMLSEEEEPKERIQVKSVSACVTFPP